MVGRNKRRSFAVKNSVQKRKYETCKKHVENDDDLRGTSDLREKRLVNAIGVSVIWRTLLLIPLI